MNKKPQEYTRKSGVSYVEITADQSGRRIDNYLLSYLKDIPKTRIYKMLRKGEVRVNRSRVKQDYKLQKQDVVRIPPVYQSGQDKRRPEPSPSLQGLIYRHIIHEDENLLVINKPPGLAVHSGTNDAFGLIEILRAMRPDDSFLELVHRLDKSTSGCLMIARNHQLLRDLHELLKQNRVSKTYQALLKGKISRSQVVDLPLSRRAGGHGKKHIQINESGKPSISRFTPVKVFSGATLARVEIDTGRTHQIRVHAASIGHPVAGDKKYGDSEFNRSLRKQGLKRMFLHADTLSLELPYTRERVSFRAPLPADLQTLLVKI